MLTDRERKIAITIMDELSRLDKLKTFDVLVYALALSRYAIKFRERNGIQAMLDYIQWAKKHDSNPDRILGTIGHDLNGMNDELMEPRSISYLNVNTH